MNIVIESNVAVEQILENTQLPSNWAELCAQYAEENPVWEE